MPKLVVLDRTFTISDVRANPLVMHDVLYWDTAGESFPRGPHLHLNPEMKACSLLEKKVHRHGPDALPTACAAALMVKQDPSGHPWAKLRSTMKASSNG